MIAPLDSIRVLDFGRVLSGPYASMFLADLGADVVKVEHPAHGDDTRIFGPPFLDGVSTYFLAINRGKRSIVLDLKRDDDKTTALALACKADVVMENFRPGVMDRLGLGYDVLRERNPRLIFCSISGFGQEEGARPGYDLVVQGLSGIPSLTGLPDGPPFKCGASIADLVAGLNAVQGILAALYNRERTGEGAFVDVSMLDGQRSLLVYHASAWLNAGVVPGRIGNAHPSIHPFCSFRTGDGFVNVAIGNESLWKRFCEVLAELGHPVGETLVQNPLFAKNQDRVENREALNDVLRPIFRAHTSDEWLDTLAKAGIATGRMATVPEALANAKLATHAHPEGGPEVKTVPLPYRISGAPQVAARRAPRLGEHTEEVLAEWLSG